MNRPKKQIAPRVETLENIALLATVVGAPVAAAVSTGLGSTGSVTTNDAQALQQDSSGGFLEQYISEIEVSRGRRSNVKAYAASVVSDHMTTNFDLQSTAGTVGITLPIGVALPSDLRNAQTMISSVRGGNVDRTYLKIMAQINAQDVANDQRLIGMTQNASVKAYAQETQAYDMNHLQGAQQLTSSPKSTYSPTVATTTISPTPTVTQQASASDAQALQTDESGGELEQLISQIAEQRATRSDVQEYAQTVVGDHQVTNYDLMTTARASGVTLPAGITVSSDIQDARRVLDASRNGSFDRVYLSVMARINAQDVMADQQLVSSTTVPGIASYAQETLSYDMTHLQGAQMLQSQQSTTYTPAG